MTRAVFNYLTPIIDSSTVTRSMALLSLEVRRETNSRSSREREAIWSLHDIYFTSYNIIREQKGPDLLNSHSSMSVPFYNRGLSKFKFLKLTGSSLIFCKLFFLTGRTFDIYKIPILKYLHLKHHCCLYRQLCDDEF